MVLAAAAGLGSRPEEALGLEQRGATEVRRVLDEEAERSRDARGRAREELERLDGERSGGRPEERPPGR
jgi:hypothetical protein